MSIIRHDKDGEGIQVTKDGTRYTRKQSSDQKSPRLKALHGCISEKLKEKKKNTSPSDRSRKEWRETFANASKECKNELDT